MLFSRGDSKPNEAPKPNRFSQLLGPADALMQIACGMNGGGEILDLAAAPMKNERLKVTDRSVDVITSRWDLHRFSDIDGVLREICRVLKPGGRLAVVLPGREEKCSFLTTPYKSAAKQKAAVKDALATFRFSVPGAFELMLGSTGYVDTWTHRYG